jgi:hypothetical protein
MHTLTGFFTDAQLAPALCAAPFVALALGGLLLETLRIVRVERAAARVRKPSRAR